MSVSPFSLTEVLGTRMPIVDVLDIGAMIEGEERYAPLLAAGVAQVTAVEPDFRQADRLQAEKPHIKRLLPVFLGTGEPATLHLTRYPGCTSLYEPDAEVIDRFSSLSTGPDGNFFVYKTRAVQTVRLDDLDPPATPDFVKIDIQGSELDVLRHGLDALSHVLVIECEAEFLPIYKNQPLFGDVQVFLREQGFTFHKMVDVAARTLAPLWHDGNPFSGASQMLWCDAIFVRSFTDLSAWSDEALLKAALILHEVYFSYDLCFMFLAEHDRRCGGLLSLSYTAGLKRHPQASRFLLNLKEYV